MVDKDAEFLKRLLATFAVEAQEHLERISSGLIELEKGGSEEARGAVIETVFREAHSLKGAARAVNLGEIESFCQALEGVFGGMKRRQTFPAGGLLDLLHEAVDFLGQMLADGGQAGSREGRARRAALLKGLEVSGREAEKGDSGAKDPAEEEVPAPEVLHPPAPPAPSHEAGGSPLTGTVRVSTVKLSTLLFQAEEMLSAKLASTQRAGDLRGATSAFRVWRKAWGRVHPLTENLVAAVRKDEGPGNPDRGELGRSLAAVADFLRWNNDFVCSLERRFTVEAKSAVRDARLLGGMVDNLLDEAKKVLMLPFASLLEILPKVVRDLSRDSGKEVDLVIHGGEIEVDRRILEEMKDPLVHLIRNCIDHGVERPEERAAKGKPRRGTVTVDVTPRDNKVELVVRDDGVGISPARVRAALPRLGIHSRDRVEELSDEDLLSCVFHSGFSTSPIITELSGRGLGLAIVREKVEKLGGTVALETVPEAGTAFRIVLPLTVATFRGIFVRVGERLFVLPTMHVARAVRLERIELKTVENRETIVVGGEPVSLVRLADVLGLAAAPAAGEGSGLFQAVLLAAAGIRIAFLVDEIVGEQEVLLKNFGPQLSRVRNVAGATVIGSGTVVPILNVSDLLKSAVRGVPGTMRPLAGEDSARIPGERRRILVAEDSITTRSLLKSILETAGYDVVTAVDGIDAFTKLKEQTCDLVVSDVDMPRMSGFDLTAKVKSDKALGETPVVLVTALASREDRERGIDVGADAYIVKGSFDQSNLLEVLRKLL